MSKYIDAEALVAKIVDTPSKIARTAQTTVETTMLVDRQNEILDIIDNMSAADVEPVKKWISVDERLPEPEVKVLIYKRWEGEVTHRIIFEILIAQIDCEGKWRGEYGVYEINGIVIAWMPLPEPPKMDAGCDYREPCEKRGIRRATDITPCIGYCKSDYDDEPCEMCKECENLESYDGGSE